MTASPNRPAFALAFSALLLAGSVLAGCDVKTTGNQAGGGAPGAQAAVANPCGTFGPTQTSTLPMQTGTNDLQIKCSAWQAFIALNWKGDPANPGQPDPNANWDSFGTPGDMSPKVWETYLEASAVFGGNGGAPLKGMWRAKRPGGKSLVRTSKFGATDLTSIDQAGSGHHWLTSQRGEITYYEIMMNQDEFEFITQEGFDLTTAAGQLACATQPGKPISDGGPPDPNAPKRGGLNFPAGKEAGWDDTDCAGNIKAYGQGVGAIEIKAAWAPLPADHSLDYRYKTAIAEIVDPNSGAKRQVTVGLVGLHIIRKRWPRLPWIWATFEHIDNSPDEAANGGFSPPALPANANQKPSPGFTFFNPTCNPATDKAYKCVHNAPPTRCGPGSPVGTCQPYNAPMQITRINPVGDPANQVTAYAWSLMPAASVFNYYRLINVQWPTQGIGQPPKDIPPGPGLTVPLYMGKPTPAGGAGGPTQIVANTTLESFQQKTNSCMDCHVYAAIASPPAIQAAAAPGALRRLTRAPANGQPQYASDYSFIFFSETKR